MDNQQNSGEQQPSPQPVLQSAPQSTSTFPNTPKGNSANFSFSQMEATKPARHWYRMILASIVVVAVIIFGVFLSVNSNFRATLFRQKFKTYTFVNERGHKYSFLFYRNSITQSDSFGTTDRAVLVSHVLKGYTYPIEVSVEGSANNSSDQAQQAIVASNNCSLLAGSVQAFSVYVSSLNVNANVCNDLGVLYVSEFGTSNSVYYMLFRLKIPQQLLSPQSNQTVTDKLNASDVESIMASFKPLP